MLGHFGDALEQSSFRLGWAVVPNIEPRQADVVRVVKFGGIQLTRFKRPNKRVVGEGRSSEVEFHKDLFPSKSCGGKEKGPDPKIGATPTNISHILAGRRRAEEFSFS